MERTKFYFAKKKLKSQDFNEVDEFIFAKKYDSSGNSNLYIYIQKNLTLMEIMSMNGIYWVIVPK